MYNPHIVIGKIGKIGRKELEEIENQKFSSKEEIYKKIGHENFDICELTDFMDDCNNQEIPSMEDFWIGYVWIKETNIEEVCRKSDLVEKVIEQIAKDLRSGDTTAIEEMLMNLDNHSLIGYLPE